MTDPKSSHKKTILSSLLFVALIIIVGAIYFLFFHHSTTSTNEMFSSSGCVTHQFSEGSSGYCVKDIQTMVDFMETDGLTQCPFVGAKSLDINGVYNASTAIQVKTVQTWENCYNKQEGDPTRISADGSVENTTWYELCTYGYQYPKQSNQSTSSYFKVSLVAGKSAGC